MTRPVSQIVQMNFQNDCAEKPLIVPVLVVCNTSDEDLERNIRTNSARDELKWICARPAHDRIAVMVGGGPSVTDHLDDIRSLMSDRTDVFAMNGASRFLREATGIYATYQVIADAKEETSQLVDPFACEHLFASQVNPKTARRVQKPALWHLESGNIERFFPEERLNRGGYSLIGGGAAVGNSALVLAYVMGYRELHLFGYDSSHRNGESHAYAQPMNQFMLCTDVEWAGKVYKSSVAMKAQSEKFQITAQALIREGCKIKVYGDGLLPAMWNTKPEHLTERDKYRLMWGAESYRTYSPGEAAVPVILERLKPDGLILDFGCGTGRASLALARLGHDVMLIDFADNCRDEEAMVLSFLEWDLTKPLPPSAKYGICCDVMEHIPTEDVETVVKNIMASAGKVFFQISTVPDVMGELIANTLHLTVKPAEWWADTFERLGFDIQWANESESVAQFVINRKES